MGSDKACSVRTKGKKLGFWKLVYIFFFCAAAGWIWEEIYCLVKHGFWVERGFLFGPILPIYGLGGIAVYWLKARLKNRAPWLMFAASFGVAGAIEYVSSWLLERIFDKKWWDYTHVPFNIGGRVHFVVLVFFGMLGLVLGYFVLPSIEKCVERQNRKLLVAVGSLMLAIFTVDCVISVAYHFGAS